MASLIHRTGVCTVNSREMEFTCTQEVMHDHGRLPVDLQCSAQWLLLGYIERQPGEQSHLATRGCALGVSGCTLGVSGCVLGVSGCVFGVSGCALGVSGCVFGVSGCVFGVSGCVFGSSGCALVVPPIGFLNTLVSPIALCVNSLEKAIALISLTAS